MDAPGTLHHVLGRGIERTKVFQEDADRENFMRRLAELSRTGSLVVYAWALMPNYFHLPARRGRGSLAQRSQPALVGGWAQVLALRRKGDKLVS